MSTEHQQYSLANQAAAIQVYALERGFEIVRTYSDSGKSGVVLKRRKALRDLLEDVVKGNAGYKVILVYDVSRWGRFQDTDEAAHYEFICKAAGVRVHYCAESFANDDTMPSMIMKMLKRTMAGEYSRELGVKCREGLRRIARMGFSTGSKVYGFQRMQVSSNREPKCILQPGQRKNEPGDRVILVPGPSGEVCCVREIFRMFVEENKMPTEIARVLRQQGIPYPGIQRTQWYACAVNRVLHNPKYAGHAVYGMQTERLRTRRVTTPRESWIVTPGAWEAIIPPEQFDRAKERFQNQTFFKTDEQILDDLRKVLKERGELTQCLIKSDKTLPSMQTYVGRFGSLSEALARIGYRRARVHALETRRRIRQLRDELLDQIIAACPGRVTLVQPNRHLKPTLRVLDTLRLSVYLCRFVGSPSGRAHWRRVQAATTEHLPLSLVVRLNHQNDGVLDHFVVPTPKRFTSADFSDSWLKAGRRLLAFPDLPDIVEEVHRSSANRK